MKRSSLVDESTQEEMILHIWLERWNRKNIIVKFNNDNGYFLESCRDALKLSRKVSRYDSSSKVKFINERP